MPLQTLEKATRARTAYPQNSMFAPHLNALPGTFRLGPLRFPIFGIFAAAGLIAALALSQRTARRTGLSPEKLWDAGMITVVTAFVVSRLLLIAENLRLFLSLPGLVLTFPSITYTGMLITTLLTLAYLRWKRVPILTALDAWAPCATLLAVFLQLGHFFEGTQAGLPTHLPWGIVAPGDTVLGRTQPVQLYAAFIALALTAFLYTHLKPGAPHLDSEMWVNNYRGQTAALCLLLGGLASYLLDMLRQPDPTLTDLPLDPTQFTALAAILIGATWLFLGPRPLALGPVSPEIPHAQ